MSLPSHDFTPERREIVQSARLFAQKIVREEEARTALAESRALLEAALLARASAVEILTRVDAIIAARMETVRLAVQALEAAGSSFDGAALDFHATLVEQVRGAAAPVTDAQAHVTLKVAP
jgi:hypothetical protein